MYMSDCCSLGCASRKTLRHAKYSNRGQMAYTAGNEETSVYDCNHAAFSPASWFHVKIRIFDEDGSGSVDFREFVMSLWNYCTLSKAALIMFAFDLYDNNNSGEIDIDEVELLLKEVGKRCVALRHKGSRLAK